MEFKAIEIAEILHGTVDGNPDAKISSFARIESGRPGTICFFANPKYEHYVYECKADIIIVNNTFEPKEKVSATLVRVEDAYSAVASLLEYVTAMKRSFRRHRGRYSKYFLSTKFGKKVYVGSFAYVGRHTTIGDFTKIYEHVYIGDNVKIGSNCIIYPGARIMPNTVIGNNVIIHANAAVGVDGFGFAPLEDGTYRKIQHTGNVVIEDNVEIGSCTIIDKSQIESTIIHKGAKISGLCFIAHNVEIGENTLIVGQTGIAGSSKIGRQCVFGGQVGIAGHLTIADNTSIGAQSGLLSNIKEPGQVYFGTPAIPYRNFMRSYAIFRQNGKI